MGLNNESQMKGKIRSPSHSWLIFKVPHVFRSLLNFNILLLKPLLGSMVKRRSSLFFLTGFIYYKVPRNTTVTYCWAWKRVAVLGVEAIITLFTFVDMFGI